MSNAVLEVFDASLQKTQVWLNDLMRAVLIVLARHISAGETQNVKHLLPKTLQELWP